MKTFHRARLKSLLAAGGAAVRLTSLLAVAAYAASALNTVIDSVRNWVAGLLAALATLLLAIGGKQDVLRMSSFTCLAHPRGVSQCRRRGALWGLFELRLVVGRSLHNANRAPTIEGRAIGL